MITEPVGGRLIAGSTSRMLERLVSYTSQRSILPLSVVLRFSVAFVLTATSALGQIELSYTPAKSLVGATAPRVIGDRILIGDDSKPTVINVAIIKVRSPDRVHLLARKTLFESVELFPWGDSEFILAGEGKYLVEAMSANGYRSIEVTIGPPPKPTPTPDPPVPGPVTSFRVIFVKESGSTLSSEQTAITGAKAVRDYLTAKTTPEGKYAGWREYDPQQNVTNEQPTMKSLWAATRSSITTVPCMIIELNGRTSVLPYPKNVADALRILKEYGGQ